LIAGGCIGKHCVRVVRVCCCMAGCRPNVFVACHYTSLYVCVCGDESRTNSCSSSCSALRGHMVGGLGGSGLPACCAVLRTHERAWQASTRVHLHLAKHTHAPASAVLHAEYVCMWQPPAGLYRGSVAGVGSEGGLLELCHRKGTGLYRIDSCTGCSPGRNSQ